MEHSPKIRLMTERVFNAKAAEQDGVLADYVRRVQSVEVLGGLAPGDVSDATMTDIAANPETGFAAVLRATTSRIVGKVNVLYPPFPYAAPKGDGATDDRVALQALFDNFDHVFIPNGTFVVSHNGATYAGKGTGLGLRLRSNLHISGHGTIKYKGGQGGNFAVMANPDDLIDNCHIEGITIDVNKTGTNVGASVSGAVLFGARNCSFDKVKVRDPSYCGLMMRGEGGSNVRFTDNDVTGSQYIGIQSTKNEKVKITGNTVIGSGDNAIDIEGNNPLGQYSDIGFSKEILVSGNHIDGCNAGVFLESAGRAIVTDNYIKNPNIGVFINRINSGAKENEVAGNIIEFEAGIVKASREGVRVSNSSGKTNVHHNTIRGAKNGMRFNTAEFMVIKDNTFEAIEKFLYWPIRQANALVKSVIGESYYIGTQNADGFPKNISPIDETSALPGRVFNCRVADAWLLESNRVMRSTYWKAKTATAQNTTWAAYSIYFNGETKLYFASNAPAISEYVKIDNVFYLVKAKASLEVTLTSADGTSGNFTGALNKLVDVYVYTPSEYAALLTD